MSLLDEYGSELATLFVYGAGIALYTLAVAILYVPMGTRMMFAKRLGAQHVATAGRRFLYVLLFPLVSFLFFLVIAASMLFMSTFSDAILDESEIMTIAMAVVLAIRIAAYFSETGAVDLAKTMPLSMLAVILVTNGFSDVRDSVARLSAFGDHLTLLGLFFVIVLVTEFLLRGIYELMGRPKSHTVPR
jgi:hypothetical protein